MTDAEYDGFASELTTLCRRYGIYFEVEAENQLCDVSLVPGFGPIDRYVVAHDRTGGRDVKLLACVVDEESEDDGDD